MDRVGAVVIGAGVVGLASARALALAGREVLILERHGAIGTEVSARNSEVMHAGLYYPRDSWKAKFCVAGNARLLEYCASRGIDHRRCGKLVVATARGQEAGLEFLHRQGTDNGVAGLRLLTAREAAALEPALHCTAALLSPNTGIVDSHALMLALLADAEAHGALLALRTPVTGGAIGKDGIVIETGGDRPHRLATDILVNSAGLSAPAVASMLTGFPAGRIPCPRFAKGSYFAVTGRSPFSRLVYPLPVPGGLGVHLTLDLAGQARFGPDVEWVPAPDHAVDPGKAAAFRAEVRRYWPGLPEDALVPAYAGVRPKVHGPEAPAADFMIEGPQDHGITGLVHLFGIESPGLTSCLALADHVADIA
ncbi:MAG: NAD(P)/FAD-dependent oxidoreductase [Rhodocyclaceae bacterium]|nr:NAD(P)/FAD-dependent oxidoreductase [Rhodocyclaceae bacterium]